jgi:hypothetical protein
LIGVGAGFIQTITPRFQQSAQTSVSIFVPLRLRPFWI